MSRRETDALRSIQRFAAGVLLDPWDVRLSLETGTEPVRPFALVEEVGSVGSDGSASFQDVTVAYAISCYLPREDSRQAAADAAMGIRERWWQAVKHGPDSARPTTDRIPLYSYEPRPTVQRVRVRGATSGTWRLRHAGVWTAPIAHNPSEGTVQAAVAAIAPGAVVHARGVGVFDLWFLGSLNGTDVPALTLDTAGLVGANQPSVRVLLQGAPAPWRGHADYLRVLSFSQRTLRDQDDPALVMVAVDLRCAFTRGPAVASAQMLLQQITSAATRP